MKNTILLILAGLFLGLIACGGDTVSFEQEATEVMAIHDEVMPMMSDMVKMRRQLEEVMADRDSTEHPQFQAAVRQLVIAEKGMWDWMAAYKKPEKVSPEAMQYLADQKVAIQQVSDAMKQAYARGEQLLEQ